MDNASAAEVQAGADVNNADATGAIGRRMISGVGSAYDAGAYMNRNLQGLILILIQIADRNSNP